MKRAWRWFTGALSVPVRLVSPRRRRAHREYKRWEALFAYREPDEAALYERIFGYPPPGTRDRE
ncbi:hypothetical protein OIE62_17225 [Streptomyces scopuliridis]|uniref:Uncharacterized protein n=1 Tax=Streptomyces scopuliridis TaxID=452529 RepID=A0ACD4ZPI6_9ACTN|nr:hypothetical protein [Streptomyces scopuliridis]WSB99711.1 hypothetical protein OG835_23730 [Streptomyces scopuliridis]WSC06590.1 hypothetical protein OIE62_17225 [Streptomyces scopuliridis]